MVYTPMQPEFFALAKEAMTVVLAEDIAILRKGLKTMLQAFPGVEVVGEAQDGLEAVDLVERLLPDVVLMDLSMPRMDGAEAIAAIKAIRPQTRILALTAFMEVERVRQTLAAGANGYLLKNVPPEVLLTAMRQVLEGRPYVSPEIAAMLIDSFVARNAREPVQGQSGLSERELAVLAHIAHGATCREIAGRLCISPKTVETHKTNIKRKLEAKTTADLIIFAIERGLAGASHLS